MIRRRRPLSDTDTGSPAGAPPPVDKAATLVPSLPSPAQRYGVERCAGGGNRAVYAVIDRMRKPLTRVVCRTGFRDAHMIVGALNR